MLMDCFNSSMVRLWGRSKRASIVQQISFNSSMVRLWVYSKMWMKLKYEVSIPVWCDCEIVGISWPANITDVSIPVWCDCEFSTSSNMTFTKKFQFQYGAIVSPLTCASPIEANEVSIPVWCDCELGYAIYNHDTDTISIPVWCDCEEGGIMKILIELDYFNSSMVRLWVKIHC